ncbi:hypothetical protein AB0D38_06380, partial [Streptomyces sp. NPDC048279]|uniref:hypothetical protein n=1 Tax=Streptomyces sp. NPDC048279 TaxID=3154714 RepID=UPI00342F4F24
MPNAEHRGHAGARPESSLPCLEEAPGTCGQAGRNDGRSRRGDSVGGNMTAALTLMAKERGGLPLLQQVLF